MSLTGMTIIILVGIITLQSENQLFLIENTSFMVILLSGIILIAWSSIENSLLTFGKKLKELEKEDK